MESRRLKKKGPTSEANYRIRLCEDLTIEMFLRSCVKSLIRAKCVCKQWYALISNSKFELDHIQYQKIHNKGRFLLQYFEDETKQYNYALFDDTNLVSDTYRNLDNFKLDLYGLHMEGPVNGLYCLYNHKDRIILWNPATGEFKTLPLPHPHFLPHFQVNDGKIGFGIDPSTHDYKLVLIRRFYNGISGEGHPSVYVEVYNLNQNTWRLLDIGDFRVCESHFCLTENTSYLNGNYYWWDNCGLVNAFDMGKEDFRQISGPKFSVSGRPSRGHLTLYEDKVALMSSNNLVFDIWVMFEEGVWINQFSFTYFPASFVVFGFWKHNLVLSTYNSPLDPNSQIVLFNMNTKELRNIGPRGTDLCFRTSIYYESLVSVGCITKHKGKRASLNTRSDFLNACSDP